MMNFRSLRKLSRIEIIVVAIIVIIIATILIITLNPTGQFSQSRNAKRNSDILAVLDAVHEYVSDDANSNNFPPGMPSVAGCGTATSAGDPPAGAKDIGTSGAHLAATLVPQYIEAIPVDPSTGSAETTGYKICTDTATNAVTVWADGTELKRPATEADLKVTR